MDEYDLTDEQMDALLAYYERHRGALDGRMEAHNAQFDQPLPQ